MLKPKYKKLSKAMRVGIKMRPRKAIGDYLRGKQFACILGCASIANGEDDVSAYRLDAMYPLLQEKVNHPTRSSKKTVMEVVVDLNDHDGWSREDIAKWVAKIEKGDEK